jgi:FMN-dependent NADH-azoreductase
MATVLYIKAHPLTEQESISVAMASAFLDQYRKVNPNDTIIPLDLYRTPAPGVDADVLRGWGKLRSGTPFEELKEDEQSKIALINETADQFAVADKYVFVSPMWNLSYPPVLKAYIDSWAIAGKTFYYTEKGPLGMLNNKKAVHIQSRGNVYEGTPNESYESGHRHLTSMLAFVGITDIQGVFAEGSNLNPANREEIKLRAVERAIQAAASF